jgi:hypothetical protein
MFKGVFQCIPAVGIFLSTQPLSWTLNLPPPHFSIASNTHPYNLYLLRCYALWYYWCSIIFFYFPSFLVFLRVVPLLQTWSTYEFVYDDTYFCVYIYLLGLSPRENTWPFSFWAWFALLNMVSSTCTHLPSNHMLLFLTAE